MDADELLKKMEAQRGHAVGAHFKWIAKLDPEFLEAFNRMTVEVLGFRADGTPNTSGLSIKVKELLACCVLATQREWDLLPGHLRRAEEHGATDKEFLEVFQLAGALTGAPALRGGVKALLALRAAGSTAP